MHTYKTSVIYFKYIHMYILYKALYAVDFRITITSDYTLPQYGTKDFIGIFLGAITSSNTSLDAGHTTTPPEERNLTFCTYPLFGIIVYIILPLGYHVSYTRQINHHN